MPGTRLVFMKILEDPHDWDLLGWHHHAEEGHNERDPLDSRHSGQVVHPTQADFLAADDGLCTTNLSHEILALGI